MTTDPLPADDAPPDPLDLDRYADNGKRYLARLYGKRDLSALRALSAGDQVCRYRFSMTPNEMIAVCRNPGPARV